MIKRYLAWKERKRRMDRAVKQALFVVGASHETRSYVCGHCGDPNSQCIHADDPDYMLVPIYEYRRTSKQTRLFVWIIIICCLSIMGLLWGLR